MLRVLAIAGLTLVLACTADGDPLALGDPPPGPGGVDDEDEVGDDDDGPPDEYWADAPDAPPGGLKILIEPIVVPAGSEALMCLFGTFEDDLAVEAFSFHQTPGFGHHMVLNSYEADEPFEDGTLTDCLPAQIDRSSPIFLTQAMVPDDPGLTVASFIPGGTAWYIESHYINTSNRDLIFHDAVILGLAPIDEVDVWLSHYGHGWGDIEIPPDQITEVVMDCMWEADLTIATLHGHMHHGLSHSVDLIRTDGSIERIYDLPDWNPQWRNDPVQEDFDGAGLEVHPGDRFVTTCRWDNNTGGTIYFPEEMCGTSGILYGSMAPINCDPSRDDGPPR